MKLNWFSPLPPLPTGIAEYTGTILPYLAARAEIVLWTDQSEWSPELERYASVKRFQGDEVSWVEASRAEATVYHMGNNPLYHRSIWQVSRRLPGIMVLHDLRLQDFFTCVFRDFFADREGYLRLMQRYYGDAGCRAGEELWSGRRNMEDMATAFPLTSACTENSIGVVVHTPGGLESLKPGSSYPLGFIPFPYAAAPNAVFESWQAKRAPAKPPYRLVVMGYLNPNRRLDSLLHAWGTSRVRNSFTLDVYGTLWDEAHVRRQIRKYGLEKAVRLHGYTPCSKLDEHLIDADLGINLRYPSMGEASMSQLQMWDHDLTSLVTRTGWYASLPAGTVAFVEQDREIEDIQQHLEAYVSDPGGFAAMGRNGRQVLIERHAPNSYADWFFEFLHHALAHHPYAAGLRLADTAGRDMNGWMTGPAADFALDKVSSEIHALTRANSRIKAMHA